MHEADNERLFCMVVRLSPNRSQWDDEVRLCGFYEVQPVCVFHLVYGFPGMSREVVGFSNETWSTRLTDHRVVCVRVCIHPSVPCVLHFHFRFCGYSSIAGICE